MELNDVYYVYDYKQKNISSASTKLPSLIPLRRIIQKMDSDSSVILMGQDITEYGGVLKSAGVLEVLVKLEIHQ